MTEICKGAIVRQVINGALLNNQLFLVLESLSNSGTYEVDLLEETVTTSDVDTYLRRDNVVLIRTGNIGKLSATTLEFVGDGSELL
jgi:hypothetical protein